MRGHLLRRRQHAAGRWVLPRDSCQRRVALERLQRAAVRREVGVCGGDLRRGLQLLIQRGAHGLEIAYLCRVAILARPGEPLVEPLARVQQSLDRQVGLAHAGQRVGAVFEEVAANMLQFVPDVTLGGARLPVERVERCLGVHLPEPRRGDLLGDGRAPGVGSRRLAHPRNRALVSVERIDVLASHQRPDRAAADIGMQALRRHARPAQRLVEAALRLRLRRPKLVRHLPLPAPRRRNLALGVDRVARETALFVLELAQQLVRDVPCRAAVRIGTEIAGLDQPLAPEVVDALAALARHVPHAGDVEPVQVRGQHVAVEPQATLPSHEAGKALRPSRGRGFDDGRRVHRTRGGIGEARRALRLSDDRLAGTLNPDRALDSEPLGRLARGGIVALGLERTHGLAAIAHARHLLLDDLPSPVRGRAGSDGLARLRQRHTFGSLSDAGASRGLEIEAERRR